MKSTVHAGRVRISLIPRVFPMFLLHSILPFPGLNYIILLIHILQKLLAYFPGLLKLQSLITYSTKMEREGLRDLVMCNDIRGRQTGSGTCIILLYKLCVDQPHSNNELYWHCLSSMLASSPWARCYKKILQWDLPPVCPLCEFMLHHCAHDKILCPCFCILYI